LIFGDLTPGLFVRHAQGLGLCRALGPELRLLSVDRVPLGESLPFVW